MELNFESEESKCRCCYETLEKNTSGIELTEELVKQVKDIARFHLGKFDLFSSAICLECDRKLKEFREFKLLIHETQRRFIAAKASAINFTRLKEEILPSAFDDLKQKTKTKINIRPSSQKDHFCPICNKYFTESRKVKLHIDRIHLRKKNFKCDLCSYSAFKKYDVQLHLTNIHLPKELLAKSSICPTCGFSFSSNSRLNIHIRRKHLKELTKKLACDLCGYRAAVLNEIKRHMQTHLPKDLKQVFPCIECGAVLSSKGSLKIHRDSKHSDMPSFACYCGKSFRQKSVYNRHFQVLHKGVKAFKCNSCHKNFSGKNHLNYHTKAFHSETKTISCRVCGNSYKNEETLKKHSIYHSDPKFDCKVCGKKYHENKKLLDHMSAHEKLEFACQSCSRSFRLESQRRYHMKKVHCKEKTTFKCELCSSSFTRKSTYRDHALRQHKELKNEEISQFLERTKNALPDVQVN